MLPDDQLLSDRRARDARIADGIMVGSQDAAEEFVRTYSKPLRWIIASCTKSDQDINELVQDALTITLEQVQAGNLRSPDRLFPYMRMIASRLGANWIRERAKARNRLGIEYLSESSADLRPTPYLEFEIKERAAIMRQALEFLTAHEREILTRFYLHGQRPEQIQLEMRLTETQFRLRKFHAKARLAKHAKRIMNPGPRKRLIHKLAV